jgi:uncharacterized glyoxalase superfamily protein PhnB
MASIKSAAPQLLVERLEDSLAYYRERLGFSCDFVYEGFYAGVSRDGAVIHLKCAPKGSAAERAPRRAEEHLDAFLAVSGIEDLHAELAGRGARITQPLQQQPWGTREFLVEDPDGHVLCFSEITESR